MGRHRLAEMVAGEQAEQKSRRRWSRRAVVALCVALGLLAAATAWALTSVGNAGGPTGRPDPGAAAIAGSELAPTADLQTDLPSTVGPSEEPSHPAPAPPASDARFVADYDTTSRSAAGFVGEVVVRNVGTGAGRWTVQIVLPPAASLAGVWNAKYERFGRTVRFSGKGELSPGGSVSFGFRVDTRKPEDGPDSCSVSGRPCN